MAAIYLRMLGYSVTLGMHGYNLYVMNGLLDNPVMEEDPNVRTFASLYPRFFTVWTMILQIVHAALGLLCDYLTLKNAQKREPQSLSLLKSFKDRMFAALLWPTVFLVSTLFWSLYHYDRGLIYPLYADKALSSTANHIFHTAVVPVVLWEVLFQPRVVPQGRKAHTVNVALLSVYMLTYLSVMYYTYIDQGVWLYPIFGIAHDTLFCFPLIIGLIGVKLYIYYHMQWVLTAMIWGSKIKIKKID